jgi:hypothetical protein
MTTPKEFATKMRDIPKILDAARRPWDAEDSHRLADAYMCDLLSELGYEEGVHIFENMNKWYA